MTKEDYKSKLAAIKQRKIDQEVKIEKAKETIVQAKLDLKIKKNELKNIDSEIKILRSSWKKQEA